MIESVKKKLNEYLHSKQLLFPRFFFLSNDDLLHILSQTKDPIRVQDHLNKCFEGIQSLSFNSELVVGSMFSQMDEEVRFNSSIETFYFKTDKQTIDEKDENAPRFHKYRTRVRTITTREVRPIENWLADVETQMRDSLRSNIVDSTIQFSNVSKKKWIFAWP